MAESNQHRALVLRLERFAELLQAKTPYLIVKLDLPGSRWERPPKLEGFVPDLLAQTVPKAMTVIGEAKTERDLESEHSGRQIVGYLTYLLSSEYPAFVLSVPWTAAASARAVVRKAMADVPDAQRVSHFVLDGVTDEKPMVDALCL